MASESELNANREEQQENQYMDVDDSLEPMVLLAPDGGKLCCLYFSSIISVGYLFNQEFVNKIIF